jgi:hypothetical protein
MRFSPILLFHICAGTLGLLSGAVAIFFRKGSPRHALAGKVFVISMLSMAASGAFMAVLKSQPGNVVGGTFTFYLVATAWLTARRADGKTTTFEIPGQIEGAGNDYGSAGWAINAEGVIAGRWRDTNFALHGFIRKP